MIFSLKYKSRLYLLVSAIRIIILYVRKCPLLLLTHMPVHLKTRQSVLVSVAVCDKTPALPPNLIIHWGDRMNWGPLIIGDKLQLSYAW